MRTDRDARETHARFDAAARRILFLLLAVVGTVVIGFKLSDVSMPTAAVVGILGIFLIMLVVLLGILERRRIEERRRNEEHERFEKPFE